MKRFFFLLFTAVMTASCLGLDSDEKDEISGVTDFQFETIEFQDDSTTFVTVTPEGFSYDLFNFYHKLDEGQTKVEGGFTISCQELPESGSTEGLVNTYRCYTPGTKLNYLNIYLVYRQNPDPALMPQHDVHFPLTTTGNCRIDGFFVANTAEVVDSVKANFKEGDKLALTAVGYRNGTKIGEVSINLAEYTSQKDSIVTKWTPFSLQSLGFVEFVDFEITSTNPDVPAYFCMDNLVYEAEFSY